VAFGDRQRQPTFRELLRRVPKRFSVGVGLILVASVTGKVGEFARDAAVLLLIFVPLEWWRPSQANFHWGWLLTGVGVLLGGGLILELIAVGSLRLRKNLEEINGTDGTE